MAPPVRFVLMRPRNPENLGACARALKNFGFSDWAWVAPFAGDGPDARKLAVHAGELLASARTEPDLASAVKDCDWVVGTSSRRIRGKRGLSPRALAALVHGRGPQGKVALVLGDERSGLTNADLHHCHDLATIPTDPGQPSINLAQALLLFAYELHVAGAAVRVKGEGPPSPALATDEELRHLDAALSALLEAARFLRDSRRKALRELAAPFRRARLTRKELRLWMAALKVAAKRQPPGGAPRGPGRRKPGR